MRWLEVPAAERQAWLERASRRISEKITKAARSAEWQQRYDYPDIQLRIAELFLAEGQIRQVKEIITQVQTEAPPFYWLSRDGRGSLRALIVDTHDAKLLSDLEQQRRKWRERPHPLYVSPPRMDLLADRDHSSTPPQPIGRDNGSNAPPVPFLTIRVRPQTGRIHHWNYYPLAQGDGRLYFARSQVQFAGAHPYDIIEYVPLDSQNRPIGKAEPGKDGFWDNVRSMPQPKLGKSPTVTSAWYVEGRLWLGTCGTGLHVFDPKTETWKGYGPEQGLPSSMVRQFFPIGGQVFYCNAGDSQYTFDAADGTVKLFQPLLPPHLEEPHKKGMYVSEFLLTWREDGRLLGLTGGGLWTDLLCTNPQHRRIASAAYEGWGSNRLHNTFGGAAEADGRRFCTTSEGLHELDSANRLVRSWWSLFHIEQANRLRLALLGPPTCPLPYSARTPRATGSKLILTNNSSLTVYDVKTDTWYGPLCYHLSRNKLLVTPDGSLWGTTPAGDALGYFVLDDVMRQATAAGRAITTTEYLRRRQAFIEAAPPLERGKLLLGMGQFDRAIAAFQKVLEAEPDQPEALLLMGFVHDRDCLKQPDEAMKYYRRLAESPNDPNASFSGLLFWMYVLKDCQRWEEALELNETLLRQYPVLDPAYSHDIRTIGNQCRQQLARKDAKPAAGRTPDNEEKPAK
jgi:tetratricopeptide (TPR) repeat protein